jgi:hypothetical protein
MVSPLLINTPALDYSRLIENCGSESDDEDTIDTSENVVIIREEKNRVLNIKKNIQLLYLRTYLKKFVTKEKTI